MADSEGIFQVVTANRLRDGLIVYMTKDGERTGWTENISYAHVAEGDDIDALMAVAEQDVTGNVVVSPYAIEIAGDHDPLTARERIRAAGPSIAFGDDAVPFNRTDFDI